MVFRRRAKSSPPEPIAGGIDPSAVAAAYRAPIADALRARAQFGQLVDTLRPGPLQERLREMTARVDAGVDAVWRSAQNATELERVVATLDPDRVADELKRARRSDADESVVAALAARFASTQRLLNALDESRSRLPILEARLGTAVAQAAELTLTPSGPATDAIDSLERELSSLVTDLDALGAASREIG